MAGLGGTVLDLAQVAKRTDPNGMPARMANTLIQSIPEIQDIPWVPSNLPTGHRSTITVGEPTVHLRRINEGVESSRSTASQITDGMSMLNAFSTVDPKLLEISGNGPAHRMQEGKMFVQSMGKKFAQLLWYGQEIDDEREFNGFMTRYNTFTGNVADNVLDGGASGSDNCSIWLVGWSPETVFGIYPKNGSAGLKHISHGLALHQESTSLGGSKMAAFTDEWAWDCGLVVKDWRYVVRISNVDVSEALSITGDQELTDYATNIMFLMVEARNKIPILGACRPVFYMPRDLFIAYEKQALARTVANVFESKQVDGQAITTCRSIPMKISDQLVYDESIVS